MLIFKLVDPSSFFRRLWINYYLMQQHMLCFAAYVSNFVVNFFY